MDLNKPHKGRLEQWKRFHAPDGYWYEGIFIGHPEFHGTAGYTSRVVVQEGDEIETRNSRYTLGRERTVLNLDELKWLLEDILPGKGSH